MSTSMENKVELPQEDSVSMPKQGPADLQSTKALVSNGDDSEINKCPEQGQISLKSHASDWAIGNEEEAESGMHSSWGLQKNPAMAPINRTGIVQGLICLGKAAAFHGFTGGSSDVGSPQTSSVDETSSPARVFELIRNSYFDLFSPLAMSMDSRVSSFFGGNTAQSTSLFTSSPSPTKQDDGFGGSFLRFDSLGPGSPLGPPRASGQLTSLTYLYIYLTLVLRSSQLGKHI
ncbi:unnamed protein product [Sphagnum compactum]